MADYKLACLVVLLVCGLNFLVEVRASFEYPRNLAELKRLEEATYVRRFWVPDEDRAEDVLDKLEMELKRSQDELHSLIKSGGDAEATQRAEHHVALAKSYLRVADVHEDRCRESDMADLVFLVNLHTGHDSSKDLVIYLKHYTWKQVTVCKPKWDRNFKSAVESQVSKESRGKLLLLIEALMSQVVDPTTGKRPARPFQRSLLHRITTRVPYRGLLLFMSQAGNEALTEGQYKDNFEGFLRTVDQSLMPTCREVCAKVKPVVTPYGVIFNNDLFEADEVRSLFYVKESGRLLEWMAGTRICCGLVQARDKPGQQSPNLLREAFVELVGSKEEDKEVEQFMSEMFGGVE